ncbi:MAG: hypothetical protein ABSE47_02550 [Acidimicrobiales bacterium]|jgi:hypothetical protein
MNPMNRVFFSAAVWSAVVLATTCTASASTWALTVRAGSAGEAKGQAGPAAPAGTAASCVSSTQRLVTVTWGSVAHASSYTVYDSTTSSSGGYTVIAAGVSGLTWTSGSLSAANYWFGVVAYVGTRWVSAQSAASVETTISTSGKACTQP